MSELTAAPYRAFNFKVDFYNAVLPDGGGEASHLCEGSFSEVTGLEATMEPKVIEVGGRNYGSAQRVGRVSFATVILKRGMTDKRHLFEWFSRSSIQGGYAQRLSVVVRMLDHQLNEKLAWRLERALPIKFKAADLNAATGELAIEELHLAHEGLFLESGGAA